jgi:hypothetical protein
MSHGVVLCKCECEGCDDFSRFLLLSSTTCWIFTFAMIQCGKSPFKGTFPLCSVLLHMKILNFLLTVVGLLLMYIRL